MRFNNILITGGAGFVGSNLAIRFKREFQDISVAAFDNLKRRGSELNLPRLKSSGVQFIHGDIRCLEDFSAVPKFDLLIDCSAEPSVQAGVKDLPLILLQNNLVGTINCLEIARRNEAAFYYISSSRVYPISAVNSLRYKEHETRFSLDPIQDLQGCSTEGISEDFTIQGPRSLYGSSKLAGELLLQEYSYQFGMPAIINRCGILTGPWQMCKVDQGVVTLWVARHFFEGSLNYLGYSGTGKQVRDILHIDDLFDLLVLQLKKFSCWDGRIYNVGGGKERSISLLELTGICREITNKRIPITGVSETSPLDFRIYLTDASRVKKDFGWSPSRDVTTIIKDIYNWIRDNERQLKTIIT